MRRGIRREGIFGGHQLTASAVFFGNFMHIPVSKCSAPTGNFCLEMVGVIFSYFPKLHMS